MKTKIMVAALALSLGGVFHPAHAEQPAAEASWMRVAMICDYGDINDQSYNQAAYEACAAYCDANGVPLTYYKPHDDSDAERIAMIENAIEEGSNVIVLPGYLFGNAIGETAPRYPDVKFIALDVSEFDITEFSGLDAIPDNVCAVTYSEEQAGFMAGYAAVKMGYHRLGFLGGMAVPAVVRYGCGFVQGANAAAVELGDYDVWINYAYGNQFYGDADITDAMKRWYGQGVDAVFACGGAIYTSAAEAAASYGGKVIGMDMDQAPAIDAWYGEDMTITSAVKAFTPTVRFLLDETEAGRFDRYAGEIRLGVGSPDPEESFVQLGASTLFNSGFTREDYARLVERLYSGYYVVSDDITCDPETYATAIAVKDYGDLK